MFPLLTRVYGFTPQQIGELTPDQLHYYIEAVGDMAMLDNPYADRKGKRAGIFSNRPVVKSSQSNKGPKLDLEAF